MHKFSSWWGLMQLNLLSTNIEKKNYFMRPWSVCGILRPWNKLVMNHTKSLVRRCTPKSYLNATCYVTTIFLMSEHISAIKYWHSAFLTNSVRDFSRINPDRESGRYMILKYLIKVTNMYNEILTLISI